MSEEEAATTNGSLEDQQETDIQASPNPKESSLMLHLSGGFTEDQYSVADPVVASQDTSNNDSCGLLPCNPGLSEAFSSTPIMDQDSAVPERRKSEERQTRKRNPSSDSESDPVAKKRWTPTRDEASSAPQQDSDVPTNLVTVTEEAKEEDVPTEQPFDSKHGCDEPMTTIRTTQPSASPLAAHTGTSSMLQEQPSHPRPVDLSPATVGHDSLDLSQHTQEEQHVQHTATSQEQNAKDARQQFRMPRPRSTWPLQEDSRSSSWNDPPPQLTRRDVLPGSRHPSDEQLQTPDGLIMVRETRVVTTTRTFYKDGKQQREETCELSRETFSHLISEELYQNYLKQSALISRGALPEAVTTSSSNLADISSSSSPTLAGGRPSEKPPTLHVACGALPAPVLPQATEDALLEKPPPESKAAPETLTCSPELEALPVSDGSDSNSTAILPGRAVFASWGDGYFYPGIVSKVLSDKKWSVQFLDAQQQREIGHGGLLLISLLPRGQSVMVKASDEFYDPAIVRDYYRQDAEVGYVVEKDDGSYSRCPKSQVIMSRDQAQATGLRPQGSPPTVPADVSLDNIVEGKRRHACKWGRRCERLVHPDPNLSRSALESSSTGDDGPPPAKKRTPTRVRMSSPSKSPTKKATPTTTPAKAASARKVTPTRRKGRAAVKDTNIFAKMAFLLTEADRREKVKWSLNVSTDEDSSDLAEDGLPYNKKELRVLISSHGGTVLESFEETQVTRARHVYLLASKHMRTLKFIQCLASGIRCLSHRWAIHSVNAGELQEMKEYALPAGYSIIEKEVLEWPSAHCIFDGKTVLVASTKQAFLETWRSVLVAAGATVVDKFPTKAQGQAPEQFLVVSFLVTDTSCPVKLARRAQALKVPAVSSEWVIQCLIHGFLLPTDMHEKFKYSSGE